MFMLAAKRIIRKNLHFELMAAPTHFETQATCLDFP
jgi:hypothetical protein